jgi:hypothetical protein
MGKLVQNNRPKAGNYNTCLPKSQINGGGNKK